MGIEAALIAGAAGVANTAVQSRAMNEQGRYARQAAEDNALMAELQAKERIRQGDVEAGRHRGRTKQLIARQRVAAAGQGIRADSGSAAQLQADAERMGEMDAEQIRLNAWQEAWGYRAQASEARSRGRMNRSAAAFQARQTAATGGLQFARDLTGAAYAYDQLQGGYAGRQVRRAGRSTQSYGYDFGGGSSNLFG